MSDFLYDSFNSVQKMDSKHILHETNQRPAFETHCGAAGGITSIYWNGCDVLVCS